MKVKLWLGLGCLALGVSSLFLGLGAVTEAHTIGYAPFGLGAALVIVSHRLLVSSQPPREEEEW